LLAFIVLLNIYQRYRSSLLSGDVFLFYVMQYSAIRFVLEFLRVDVTQVAGVNFSQVVCALAFVASLLYFLYRHRAGAPVPQPSEEAQAAAPQ